MSEIQDIITSEMRATFPDWMYECYKNSRAPFQLARAFDRIVHENNNRWLATVDEMIEETPEYYTFGQKNLRKLILEELKTRMEAAQ